MSFFKWFLGINQGKAKKASGVQKDGYRLLANIVSAVIRASGNCFEAIKGFIDPKSEEKKQEAEVMIFYEFIYFFAYITLQIAFKTLSLSQFKKFRSYFLALVAPTAIEGFFSACPEDMKERLRAEFLEDFYRTEIEYSQSKELMSKDNPLTSDSLLSKLGRNISSIVDGDSINLATVLAVIPLAASQLLEGDLDTRNMERLIKNFAAVS